MNRPAHHTAEATPDRDPFDGDLEVLAAIDAERVRQQGGIELIASENVASRAVRAAQGSIFTDKYAEGYPGRRYYGGCGPSDRIEQLAIDRVRRLFDAVWANVQPHSGASANLAVFFALLQPGDTILGLDLACGGHLTHGSPRDPFGALVQCRDLQGPARR